MGTGSSVYLTPVSLKMCMSEGGLVLVIIQLEAFTQCAFGGVGLSSALLSRMSSLSLPKQTSVQFHFSSRGLVLKASHLCCLGITLVCMGRDSLGLLYFVGLAARKRPLLRFIISGQFAL